MTFAIGDIVHLKSAPQVLMTVEHFHTDETQFPDGLASCLWYDATGTLKRENFIAPTLKLMLPASANRDEAEACQS